MKAIDRESILLDEITDIESSSLSEEYIKSLSSTGCRFYLQRWEYKESSGRAAPVKGPIDLLWALGQSDEIRENLVSLFTEFCNSLGAANELSKTAHRVANSPMKTRDEEMKWMENNKELLAELAGKWIVIQGSQLIASSQDFAVALKESKDRGVETPFILYVPEPVHGGVIGI